MKTRNWFLIVILVLIATAGILFLQGKEVEPELNFEVAEVLEQSCELDEECETPMDYLIRSNCPYESRCLKGKCTVVCPEF